MKIINLIVCIGVAWAGVAAAAPRVTAQGQLKAATAEHQAGNYQKALEHIEKGLAVARKDLKLLGLKGTLLLELRDYAGALAVYERYLAAGARGANQREAKKIVEKLNAVKTTFLEVTVENGPAEIYLGSKSQGLLCRAEPSCNQAVLPDQYRLIAERPGFERWTGDVTIESGKTTQVAVTLAEQSSLLTVRAEPAGARVLVDGAAHDAPAEVAPGRHRVVVSLPGHAEERREIEAREGRPIELAVALVPLVPIRVQPAGATLLLGGKPVVIQGDRIALPPGEHILVVRAPGFEDRRIEIPAERGADYQLAVELEPERAAATEPAGETSPRGRFTARRKLALVMGGLGLAAAGTGVALTVQAGNIEDDGTLDADQRRQTRTLQSHLAYGAAGLFAAVAIGLWLDGTPGPAGSGPRVAVTPRLDRGAAIELAVRF